MLEISNAAAENAIRPVAVSRKNWLVVGSERGGHAAAVLFSLLATCRQNRVNPWQWLIHVLEQLPVTADVDYRSLLPFHFTDSFPPEALTIGYYGSMHRGVDRSFASFARSAGARTYHRVRVR